MVKNTQPNIKDAKHSKKYKPLCDWDKKTPLNDALGTQVPTILLSVLFHKLFHCCEFIGFYII